MTSTYVVTFYSFKGGVGRTTLLVNVAHALAEQGERVLIWDLDLEAPGVHHFPGLEPPEAIWQSGSIEWLGQTPAAPAGALDAWPGDAWLTKLGDRVYEPRTTGLLVLPAHGTHVDLGRAYAQIDWHALFVEDPARGLHLFTRARDALVERFQPSFLFIDARTGVSDLGGFLTGFLPDCTALVGNYSRQSTAGLSMVYVALDHFASSEKAQAEHHRAHKLERLLVASPVPTAPAEQAKGRARWAETFPGVAPRSQIEIPLVENLLYAEEVLVRSAPSSDAASAYRAVAERLLDLANVRSREDEDRTAAGDDPFERRVERLLQLLGYEMTTDIAGTLVARQRSVSHDRVYEVITWPAGKKRTPLLAQAPGHELLVIAEHPAPLYTEASSNDVTFRSLRDLEDKLVDLKAYAAAIRRGFEDSLLARGYVELHAAGAGGALETAMRWVDGEGPQVLFVVGDDGSGKTSFVRRLAYELVTRPDAPVPIVISLRQTQISLTLEAILQQHLGETLGWYGNPEAVRYLLERGRVVLLFDGLDEIGAEHLSALTRPTETPGETPAGNRVLITSRAQPAGAGDAVTIEIAPFDDRQIERFLRNKLGTSAPRALAAVRANHSKKMLAQQPMMLALMSNDETLALDQGDLTKAQLCERYLEPWMRGGPERSSLLYALAAEIWRQPDHELSLGAFAKRVGRDPRELDAELRTAPCLVRSAASVYRFSHSTYLEYCLARYVANEAGRGEDAAMMPRLSPSALEMIEELKHVT